MHAVWWQRQRWRVSKQLGTDFATHEMSQYSRSRRRAKCYCLTFACVKIMCTRSTKLFIWLAQYISTSATRLKNWKSKFNNFIFIITNTTHELWRHDRVIVQSRAVPCDNSEIQRSTGNSVVVHVFQWAQGRVRSIKYGQRRIYIGIVVLKMKWFTSD